MADSVLYFPSIRVPESGWFTRVLLYWDSVGTIVPDSYLDDPHFLRPYTSGLNHYGLLKYVSPDPVSWKAPKYFESFVPMIEEFASEEEHIALADRETVCIHVDKLGYGLALVLCGHGLAEPVSQQAPEWDAWFKVEKRTGDLFMAFLASLLGQIQEQPMDPITDSAECLEAFTRIPGGRHIEPSRNLIRAEILDDLLPAPIDPVDPARLAEFKDRHCKLLTNFRVMVEQRVVSACAIQDLELRKEQVRLTRRELAGQLEEITARMQEHKWRRIGLGTLLAVVAAGLVTTDAALTGGKLTIAGASLGLTSAVWSALDGARTPGDLLERPMAYAALAHRKLETQQ